MLLYISAILHEDKMSPIAKRACPSPLNDSLEKRLKRISIEGNIGKTFTFFVVSTVSIFHCWTYPLNAINPAFIRLKLLFTEVYANTITVLTFIKKINIYWYILFQDDLDVDEHFLFLLLFIILLCIIYYYFLLQ